MCSGTVFSVGHMLGGNAQGLSCSTFDLNGRSDNRRASQVECTIPVVLYMSQLIYNEV